MYTVGVISDTHGLLRPEAVAALQGVDAILHAGDIGAPEVIHELERIAPVKAIRGNVDTDLWASVFPVTLTIELGGREFHLIHNEAELMKPPVGVAAVVFGHSHKAAVEDRGGVLYFNPGSAGPRRFRLPVTVGKIRIVDGELRPGIIELKV